MRSRWLQIRTKSSRRRRNIVAAADIVALRARNCRRQTAQPSHAARVKPAMVRLAVSTGTAAMTVAAIATVIVLAGITVSRICAVATVGATVRNAAMARKWTIIASM